MTKWALAVLIFSGLIQPANAEEQANATLAKLKNNSSNQSAVFEKGMTEVGVFYLVTGLVIADLASNAKYHGRLICYPPKMPITSDLVLEIFKEYLTQHPEDGKLPMGVAALKAMENAFPCDRAKGGQ